MPNAHIEAAVKEAELLVHFSQRNGKEIQVGLIQEISNARHLLESNQLSGEAEARFHTAYNKLAHELAPVTVGSIQDSVADYGVVQRTIFWKERKVARAARAVTFYRNLGVAALLLLLGVQIYWVIGAKLVADIEDLNKPKEETVSEQGTLQGQTAVSVRYTLLNDWHRVLTSTKVSESPLVPNAVANESGAGWLEPPKAETPEARTALLVKSKHRLDVMQAYILPLFYGLVGAVAYVLRQLIIETRTRTFREESLPAYQLRLFLGMLSGLAVGWFFTPSQLSPGAAAITPIALSFLAGYSVEVLFSAMDSLVQKFGSQSQASPG